MTFDGPRMLIVGGGTQVDYSGEEENRRKMGENRGVARVLMFKIG